MHAEIFTEERAWSLHIIGTVIVLNSPGVENDAWRDLCFWRLCTGTCTYLGDMSSSRLLIVMHPENDLANWMIFTTDWTWLFRNMCFEAHGQRLDGWATLEAALPSFVRQGDLLQMYFLSLLCKHMASLERIALAWRNRMLIESHLGSSSEGPGILRKNGKSLLGRHFEIGNQERRGCDTKCLSLLRLL